MYSRTNILHYTYSTKYGKIYLNSLKNISQEVKMINDYIQEHGSIDLAYKYNIVKKE